LLREKIKGLVEDFLGRNNLTPQEMTAYLLHPGGQKLLMCVEEELGLRRSHTEFSWDVLRDYGNMSSATILFILQEWLTKRQMNPGDYGLMAGFGPGFSSELLLLQWT
jgi:alkylresorcinol/alkylpyrone synthase